MSYVVSIQLFVVVCCWMAFTSRSLNLLAESFSFLSCLENVVNFFFFVRFCFMVFSTFATCSAQKLEWYMKSRRRARWQVSFKRTWKHVNIKEGKVEMMVDTWWYDEQVEKSTVNWCRNSLWKLLSSSSRVLIFRVPEKLKVETTENCEQVSRICYNVKTGGKKEKVKSIWIHFLSFHSCSCILWVKVENDENTREILFESYPDVFIRLPKLQVCISWKKLCKFCRKLVIFPSSLFTLFLELSSQDFNLHWRCDNGLHKEKVSPSSRRSFTVKFVLVYPRNFLCLKISVFFKSDAKILAYFERRSKLRLKSRD